MTAFLTLSISTCLATPLNNLATGQTAIGLSTDTFYLEHKFSDTFTLGIQNENLDNGPNMSDVYGQLKLADNFRAIFGNRSFDSTSKFYIGIGADNELAPGCTGYASLIGSDQFKELQLGANFKLSRSADLNVGYHSYMPDRGSNDNGVSVGVTFRF